MPKHGGEDYYAMYYNKDAPFQKRNSKKYRKPTSTQVLDFLQSSIYKFNRKYGLKAKLILMSPQMKAVVDDRERGKTFLKGIILETTTLLQGLSTIQITENDEVIK